MEITKTKIFTLSVALLFTITAYAGTSSGISSGEKAPQFKAQDSQQSTFNLQDSLKKGPVVLVFYRGGWCPYCNTQLRSLQKDVVPELKAKNAKLVAISVDTLDEALKTKTKEKLDMILISDSEAKIIKQYGLAYTVPLELVKKYKSNYRIDLEKSSGKKHHIIAIPAVYVIGKNGVIAFANANEDYKVRTQNKDILKALQSL